MASRLKKEIAIKRAEAIQSLSAEQIIEFDLNEAMHLEQIETARQMHSELFSEESDSHYDSSWDANDREKGINPMSDDYVLRVNNKRLEMGFKPLAKNGLPVDSETFNFIIGVIENDEQKKIDKLTEIKDKYNKG